MVLTQIDGKFPRKSLR